MTVNPTQSKANQRKETQSKKYTVFKMDFQSKTSYFLLRCIDRTLAPFYKDNDKNSSVRDKNMETRLNAKKHSILLATLNYLYYKLEDHSAKFGNKIYIEKCVYFSRFFPHIMNLFYESYYLRKNVPGLEEGELTEDSPISAVEVCLDYLAERLHKLGLGDEGDYEFTYGDTDYESYSEDDYDSDYGPDYDFEDEYEQYI